MRILEPCASRPTAFAVGKVQGGVGIGFAMDDGKLSVGIHTGVKVQGTLVQTPLEVQYFVQGPGADPPEEPTSRIGLLSLTLSRFGLLSLTLLEQVCKSGCAIVVRRHDASGAKEMRIDLFEAADASKSPRPSG